MTALLHVLLRGVILYVYLLIVIRLAGKRTISRGTPFDFIVALIISDLPDDFIWGEVPLAQGLVAISTLMLVHALVLYGGARSAILLRIIESLPSPLIHAGQTIQKNLAFERISKMELEEVLREHEIESHDQVQEARLEPTGKVSVQRTPETRFAEKRDLSKLEQAL